MALDSQNLPQHVSIIMDGNRRWAREQGKLAAEGHRYVVDNVIEPLVDHCIELGIPYLTLWAFSTENWDRDKAELQAMMKLFRYGLGKKVDRLHEKGVKLNVLGELDKFPEDIAKQSRQMMELTKDNDQITVTFALNYGGRDEIIRAANRYLTAKMEELENAAEGEEVEFGFFEEDFGEFLDTAGMPDPDLIIRPGGQLRLSGFMPWQSVYAELYFTDVLMPDFSIEQFDAALEDYQNRQRRFGR
ncbi:di-trans,poly-cis-decaprenylcistransferase [Candidatus Woesebacteria bacterium]|nr:di-trans,poly-cis-decaprenylcistransferase [Candidatus Woesebacteria bacterium]MCD8546532.1 di-trans,poly-cis-decaprenylcistransferase [Candidatus Woesebacteria bacterium]